MKATSRQLHTSFLHKIVFLSLYFLIALSAPIFAAGKADDRGPAVEKYLNEFSSLQDFPIIHTSIKNVLNKMPHEDFQKVTDRRRPVLFVEFYDSGTARFASSQEFIVSKGDEPCCQDGFTLVKLGLALARSETPDAVEGVVAHELAHRVLDHIRNNHTDCDAEREANALIKKWGFSEEFKEAGRMFGRREGDPVSCQEKDEKSQDAKGPAVIPG